LHACMHTYIHTYLSIYLYKCMLVYQLGIKLCVRVVKNGFGSGSMYQNTYLFKLIAGRRSIMICWINFVCHHTN